MADKEGGFDCEFAEKPPKRVQSECPLCLLVLRDPYQATCCGYGFCRVCIERIRADDQPCPCCKAEGFDCFEDKGRKRLLNDYQVHCINKKLGCQWVGELGELDNHLNSKPPQDKQLEGCQFTQVLCLHCFKPFQRSDIVIHQNDQCLERPFSCEYCEEYDSSFEDVTTNHWPVCGSYPVQCPNKCSSETMERRNLESHIANDCPLTIIDCDFKGIGCEVRVPRKDLSTHLTEALVAHMSLQTKQLMDLKEENELLKQHLTQQMKEDNSKLKLQLKEIKEENQKMKQQLMALMEEEKERMRKEMKKDKQMKQQLTNEIKKENDQMKWQLAEQMLKEEQLERQVEALAKDLWEYRTKTLVCPIEIPMTNFKQHKKDHDEWYSPPFYTHPKGYKMCLNVYSGGDGKGVNTHVSLYFFFMKGEFDEQLEWPFQGKFSIQLLNQCGEEGHHTRVIKFDAEDKVSRVVDGERASSGWGYTTFIAHTQLTPKFLQNDCLKFRVEKLTSI